MNGDDPKIQVFVGTRHLHSILGRDSSGHLVPANKPLPDAQYPDDQLQSGLAKKTVFDVLKWFHESVFSEQGSAEFRDDAAKIVSAQQKEIHRVAREEYYRLVLGEHHRPDFECTLEDARRSLAIHEVLPHGSLLPGRKPVWLPDFSVGVRCFGFFGRAPLTDRGAYVAGSECFYTPWGQPPISPTTSDDIVRNLLGGFPRVRYGKEASFSDIECHLCDTLDKVYEKAKSFWDKIRETIEWTRSTSNSENPPEAQLGEVNDADRLVIDAIVQGFQGHRFLRRDNPEVPIVARHRLLAASATRQGLGKRVVSALFPVDLWTPLKAPVKHFVLQAAEQVGGLVCTPLYPNSPSREDMDELVEDVKRDGEILGYDEYSGEVEYKFGDLDFYQHSPALKKLGMHSAVERRLNLIAPSGSNESPSTSTSENGPESEQNKTRKFRGVTVEDFIGHTFNTVVTSEEWLKDWKAAIYENQAALYDNDIEKSLYLQGILDLYPLHKRILGLVEYMIIPEIGVRGPASKVYSDAFCGGNGTLCRAGLTRKDGILATLVTEGNWLIFAKKRSARGAKVLDLACMLDKLIADVVAASGVKANSLTLNPASPSEQVKSLDRVSVKSDKGAALISLFLGKIALMLRNAIEHGSDRVAGEALMIDCSEYWSQPRDNITILQWDTEKAESIKWGSLKSLPGVEPQAAMGLVLTPASLKRCLVLISLVLKGCESHLGITYPKEST